MNDLYSLEAEHGVLGAILKQPHLIDILTSELKPDDFHWPENQELIRLIIRLNDDGVAIDPIVLASNQEALTEDVFTLEYASTVMANVPSVANAKVYANIVKERSQLRLLSSIAEKMNDLAYEEIPVNEKIGMAQTMVLALDGESSDGECELMEDILYAHLDTLDARSHNKGKLDGLSTGIKDLDEKLQGLKPGQMVVIAGRPSMGKTTIAMNIAEDVALRQGKAAVVFSLEMSKGQIMDRMLASTGRVPLSSIKDGSAPGEFPNEMQAGAAKIKGKKLIVSDCTGMTVGRIRSMARRQRHKHGELGTIVIDYLGLLEGEGSNRTEAVSAMSRQIKLMARELNCPVLVLAQLNRGCEQRPDKRPVLSDLRESGAIEQDADIVLFVYRDEVYHPDTDAKGVAEILIRKNRDGEVGAVRTAFLGQFSRFENLAAGSMAAAREVDW